MTNQATRVSNLPRLKLPALPLAAITSLQWRLCEMQCIQIKIQKCVNLFLNNKLKKSCNEKCGLKTQPCGTPGRCKCVVEEQRRLTCVCQLSCFENTENTLICFWCTHCTSSGKVFIKPQSNGPRFEVISFRHKADTLCGGFCFDVCSYKAFHSARVE